MSACDKGGRLDKALEIYDDMQAAGLQPDYMTYSNLVTGARVLRFDGCIRWNVYTWQAMASPLGRPSLCFTRCSFERKAPFMINVVFNPCGEPWHWPTDSHRKKGLLSGLGAQVINKSS